MHEIILLLFSCSIINVECIKIGSFNIQVFGQNKVSKTDVLSILVKILSRYDLIVVQEIRDAKNTAFRHLVDELNRLVKVILIGWNYYNHPLPFRYTKGNYKFVISEKLGRTNSKEQYGVIYKPDLIRIGKMVTFDNKKNLFERPPMAVEVHTTSSAIPMFALVVVHLDPDSVFEEVNNLYTFVKHIIKVWHTQVSGLT
ncbi:unnamed protein product [Trichobilharzia regenti]|nr:unnamed protein product [Trichobilharzia regenti]